MLWMMNIDKSCKRFTTLYVNGRDVSVVQPAHSIIGSIYAVRRTRTVRRAMRRHGSTGTGSGSGTGTDRVPSRSRSVRPG